MTSQCFVELTAILRLAWNTSQQTEDKREKIQALSLAEECYEKKLDLLTNATVDAIRFTKQSQDKIIIMSKEEEQDDNESKEEPDYYYDEDKEQLEEEEQERETGEITNGVF